MKKKLITISFISLFSVILWVFVSFSGEFSINLKLPIEIINIPDGYAMSSLSAKEVSLSLKGQGWQLAQHTLGRNPKFLAASTGKPGIHSITTRNSLDNNEWLSSSLQIAEINPEKIDIEIESIVTKKVPINPIMTISYKPGYGLVSPIETNPDSIIVTGPKSLIGQINYVTTKNINFESVEKNVNSKIEFVPIEFIKLNRYDCNVVFQVQKIVDKTFDNLHVEARNVPGYYDLVLSPSRIKVVLRGGLNILSKIKEEDIQPYVMFRQALSDTLGAIEPFIDIPEFTTIIDKKPRRLDYIIKKY
jgi:YbbR domain-containing protein